MYFNLNTERLELAHTDAVEDALAKADNTIRVHQESIFFSCD
jgi:hypothetical protein